MNIAKKLLLVASTALVSGCLAQAVQETGYDDMARAGELYSRVRYSSAEAEEACREIDRELPLARSIQAILFNETPADSAASQRACQATAMQRELSLSLLKLNCGCRRTQVITDGLFREEPDEPGGPRRRPVTDGFAAGDVRKIYVTDESHRGVDHNLGSADPEEHPDAASSKNLDEKRAFPSSAIKPDWQYSELVDRGVCEPDSDTDRGQCQSLLSSVGRDNEVLALCDKTLNGEESREAPTSQSINSNQSNFSKFIIKAYAACTAYRESGELPPGNVPEYPDYDQDPSDGDYQAPDPGEPELPDIPDT